MVGKSGLIKVSSVLVAVMFLVGLFPTPGDISKVERRLPNNEIPPELLSTPIETSRGWVGSEFIISYDEAGQFDAHSPDIAVAPPGTPWEGSIHAVWAELNNSVEFPYAEIQYSKSEPGANGISWSNDNAAEGDRLISQDYTNTGGDNPGDASTPSIAIDPMGWIHVIWVEQYPDWTYEIHYSRSEDNGETWTGYDKKATIGDILVTSRTGEDALWINQPRIAVTEAPLTIHVIWDEVPYNGDSSEIWYVKSSNQGDTWTQPIQVSASGVPFGPGAHEPDIATGGPTGQIIHVVWTRDMEIEPGVWCSEVFYSRSINNGDSWEPERLISMMAPDSYATRARLDALGDQVHVIWSQWNPTGSSEVYYSFSEDGGTLWSGESMDITVSFEDGQDAENPVIATVMGPGGPEAHVIWVERDETSPNGTMEIHYSMTAMPQDPISWTGFDHDEVLSHPDSGDFAEAYNPALDVGIIGGKVRPQIVWEELNSLDGSGKIDKNNEIHYIPDTTFDIPVHLGWNLISVPLIQENTSIDTVLDDSQGDGLTTWNKVKYYSNDGTQLEWQSCHANVSEERWTLTNVDHKMGLWVHIDSLGDGNLTVYGDYGNSTQITLRAGWNLVGYPAQTSKSITDSLGSINDLPVEGYDINSTYKISQLSGSYMMKPGEGYWVHVASDTVWTIDW